MQICAICRTVLTDDEFKHCQVLCFDHCEEEHLTHVKKCDVKDCHYKKICNAEKARR